MIARPLAWESLPWAREADRGRVSPGASRIKEALRNHWFRCDGDVGDGSSGSDLGKKLPPSIAYYFVGASSLIAYIDTE